MLFEDRREAGKKLAEKLLKYKEENPIILALPRGGVVVGYEVAKALEVTLDVIVVKKLSAPRNPEFGIGAVAPNGVTILDRDTIELLKISKDQLNDIKKEQEKDLKRKINLYKAYDSLSDVKDKTVILVDDGLATGVSAQAAIEAVKKNLPKKLIFAFPVCAYETAEMIKHQVDDLICLSSPQDFFPFR